MNVPEVGVGCIVSREGEILLIREVSVGSRRKAFRSSLHQLRESGEATRPPGGLD